VALLALIQSGILRRREQAGRRFQEAFSLATREENRAGDPLRGLCHLGRSGISRPKGVVTRRTSLRFDGGKPPHTARLGLSPGVRNACVSMELGAVLSGADRARLCLLGWVGSHFAMDRDRPGATLDGVCAPRVASHCRGRGHQCNYFHGGPTP